MNIRSCALNADISMMIACVAPKLLLPPALLLLLALPAHAGVCGALKLAATGKRAAAELGCHAKAVAKGKPLAAACLGKAATSFDTVFAKAEAKGDCAVSGDAGAIATRVGDAVTAITAALGGPGPSACTKTKLLAAGKKAAAKHACLAKGEKKTPARGVDPACLTKADAKFVQAFRKAEAKGDCLAADGDAPAIELLVDDLLLGTRHTVAPPVSTCAPIAATTVHGDGFYGNTRLAPIVKGKVPCLHSDTLATTKCAFSTVPGSESGVWLEGPSGLYAKTGQSISKTGEPYGEYVVAADVAQGPPPCMDAAGLDTAGRVPEGTELDIFCTLEDVLMPWNNAVDEIWGGWVPLWNYADGVVCSADADRWPDYPDYEGHGGLGDNVYCWSGPGAALNDINGLERDWLGYYYNGAEFCHMIRTSGFEVPGAKRPGTRSYPYPGSVNTSTRIVWRPVVATNIANFVIPDPSVPTPTPTPTDPNATPTEPDATSTPDPDATETATPPPDATEAATPSATRSTTPSPTPTVTPEPDYRVDTTFDDPALSGCDSETPADCSLRGALANAYGTLAAKTIAIPAGTYVLTATATCVHKTSQFGQHNIYDTTTLCVGGNVTLVGDGAASTIIDGNDTDRVMLVGNGGPTRIEGVTLRGGHMEGGSLYGAGGAINNAGELTLSDCVVTASSAASGGGGGIYSSNTLLVERSTISGNSAPTGGGIHTDSFNVPVDATIVDSAIIDNHATVEHGGGVFVYSGNVGGTTTIRGTTIAGNDAAISGGGIAIAGLDGTVAMTNSTLSGNRCFWYYGGGLADLGRTTIHMRNVTVTGNRSEDAGGTNGAAGGVSIGGTSTATLANTIIAGNTAPGFAPDCYDGGGAAAFTSLGYNLIGTQGDVGNGTTYCDLTAADGDTFGEDPLLGALGDNGGPTETHLPAAGSPAIDTGDPNGCLDVDQGALATDQRQAPRPADGNGDQDARCDRGAVEVQ